jgi:hypothetical protein
MARPTHANIFVLLAILALSGATMVWLFWHHPLKISIATIAVLAAVGISVRLAGSIGTDSNSDLEKGEQSI